MTADDDRAELLSNTAYGGYLGAGFMLIPEELDLQVRTSTVQGDFKKSPALMAANACVEAGVPTLGQLPLEAELGRATDQGMPIVAAEPEHPSALRFREIARRVAGRLSVQSREARIRMPKIRITD